MIFQPTDSLNIVTSSTADTDIVIAMEDENGVLKTTLHKLSAATSTEAISDKSSNGSSPSKLIYVSITNYDSVDSQTVSIYLTRSGTDYLLIHPVVIPIGETLQFTLAAGWVIV